LLEPEQEYGNQNARDDTLKTTEAVKRKGPSKGETKRKTAREEGSSEGTHTEEQNLRAVCNRAQKATRGRVRKGED